MRLPNGNDDECGFFLAVEFCFFAVITRSLTSSFVRVFLLFHFFIFFCACCAFHFHSVSNSNRMVQFLRPLVFSFFLFYLLFFFSSILFVIHCRPFYINFFIRTRFFFFVSPDFFPAAFFSLSLSLSFGRSVFPVFFYIFQKGSWKNK